jgi:hypothetical protein
VLPHDPAAYTQQWNFSVQREVGVGVAIDIAYARSKPEPNARQNRHRQPTSETNAGINTHTMPPQVAASTGPDILSHAIESYTALPFSQRHRPERPLLCAAYQGSKPDQRHLVPAGLGDGIQIYRPRG